MNKEQVMQRRRELCYKSSELYSEYLKTKDRKRKKELDKQLSAIGDELCKLKVGDGSKIIKDIENTKEMKKEMFKPWDKHGYKLNKVDLITALLHGYTFKEICKANFMDDKKLWNMRYEWDIEFLTPKLLSKFKVEDLPFILEALEEYENTGIFKIFGHELELD